MCGDKALGCNFDAISCESCKAFFRRNALKAKVQIDDPFSVASVQQSYKVGGSAADIHCMLHLSSGERTDI